MACFVDARNIISTINGSLKYAGRLNPSIVLAVDISRPVRNPVKRRPDVPNTFSACVNSVSACICTCRPYQLGGESPPRRRFGGESRPRRRFCCVRVFDVLS